MIFKRAMLAAFTCAAALSASAAARVLPTPREISYCGGELVAKGLSVGGASVAPEYAVSSLKPLFAEGGVPLEFRRDGALAAQEYRLSVTPSNVVASASSDAGFIYASMTLLQLAERRGAEWAIPLCAVSDRPAFSTRGINWNLFVECRGWSQDQLDGEEAFLRRSVAALDLMARFKLNAVLVDGTGWNPERFPGYGRLMRRLGAEARRRGIATGFVGYSAGYGAQYFSWDGPKFTNLNERGEAFLCFGSARKPEPGKSGTCLTDAKLNAAKVANLKAFVDAVDPGFLYIHGSDVNRRDDCEKQWKSRCAACRARWPSDDTLAPDGMAGAFADLYDRLYEGAGNGRCVFHFVSPNYTYWSEDDDEWRYHCEYFAALTKCLRNKCLRVMLREQYLCADGTPRFGMLRDAVGPEAKLSAISFTGCDGFYNSHLFSADVALARLWKGLDDVIVASGSAYQEPRQVAIAEYLWNPEGSPYRIDIPEDAGKFSAFYERLVACEERPEAVFGEGGLLGEACRRLYGPVAGPEIARVEHPREYPILPLTSKWMPGFYFAELYEGFKKLYWCEKVVSRVEDIRRYRSELAAARTATVRAEAAFGKASLEINVVACRRALAFADASKEWMDAMELALEALSDESRRSAALEAAGRLEASARRLLAEYEPLRKKALDPSGADIVAAVDTARFLIYEAESIRLTLEKGVWREHPRKAWW